MARMGRKRKNNGLGLPPRVYAKHGAFYYVHPDNKWERLGTDLAAAIAEGQRRNGGQGYGTMKWWYGEFLEHCRKRVGKPKSQRGISERTYKDYSQAKERLDIAFGHMMPASIRPDHIGAYLEEGAEAGRPVRANREKAALSACFSWLMLKPEADVLANPCIGVRRNPEDSRDRYVEDAEYAAVYGHATRSVRVMMDLVYRTLQRPDDVMRWSAANLTVRGGRRVITTVQSKTKKRLEIAVSPEIDAALESVGVRPGQKVVALRQPFVRRLDGDAYTYDGLSSNLKHAIEKAGVPTFGFQDLKAKGATDMFLAGVPIALISALCGHKSIRTTEIYIKRRLRSVVEPNAVALSNIQ